MFSLFTLFALLLLSLSATASPLSKRAGVTPSLPSSAVGFGPAGTYPRATHLADGSLLGVYSSSDGDDKVQNVVISYDNGATWSARGEITRGVGDVGNPFVLQLSTGRILAAFRNHDLQNGSSGPYTFYRITICYSDDLGASWQYLSTPATLPGGTLGIWEPFLRLTTTNTLQLYYSQELAANDQDNVMRTSTDGGVTWSDPITVSGGGLVVRDGMTGVADMGGGNLIAIFETGNGGFTVNSVTSPDDGATWGNRRPVYAPADATKNAGAPQIVNVGGTLVASFMTDEDGAGGQWPSGAAIKIVTSIDGGATWGAKTTVFDIQSFWAGMLTISGSSLLVLAEHQPDGAVAQAVVLS